MTDRTTGTMKKSGRMLKRTGAEITRVMRDRLRVGRNAARQRKERRNSIAAPAVAGACAAR